ncbi:MAG: citrate synthase family protein [Acidobacteria bacterium]|nr:citrate synthase family protein [Acidobacteriota bacterium]
MEWLTAGEAAAELGVKPATLYAYVSRGVLHSERTPGQRTSRFRRSEVDRLAGRRRQRATGDIVVDSALTSIDPAGRLWYRGRDAVGMTDAWSYEQVAEWLWSGQDVDELPPWRASPAALRAGRRAQSGLPPEATFADRLRVVTAAVAATDALRHDRRPPAVVATGRALVAAEVDSLPDLGAAPPSDGSVARRLWPKLSPMPARPAGVAALDRALGLVADHELAASTFAARVAASTWADPYLVVLSGMAALGGPLHGQASDQARMLLREAAATSPEAAVGEWLRRGDDLPGFGHSVYTGPDPRAPALLAAVEQSRPPAALWRTIEDVLRVVTSRQGPHPNIDFALAALGETARMPLGAGEAIFAVARTAGWVAHAIEEYGHRLRFRPRAEYTGPPPAT